MNYRVGLTTALILGIVGLVVGSSIILETDPTTVAPVVKALLFGAIFFALAGFATPVLFYSKFYSSNREILFSNYPVALRQSILVSLLVTALLLLQSLRSLTWWDAILLVAGISFTELAFRSKR